MSAQLGLGAVFEPLMSDAERDKWRASETHHTPIGIALHALQWARYRLNFTPKRLLDLGAGRGCFGMLARAVWPGVHLTAVELRDEGSHLARWYDEVVISPASEWARSYTGPAFDGLVGNPPYSLAYEFLGIGARVVRKGGTMIQVQSTQWSQQAVHWDMLRVLCPCEQLRLTGRPSFSGDGKTDSLNASVWYYDTSRLTSRSPSWATYQLPPADAPARSWYLPHVPGASDEVTGSWEREPGGCLWVRDRRGERAHLVHAVECPKLWT